MQLTRSGAIGALTAAAAMPWLRAADAQALATVRVAVLPLENAAEPWYGAELGAFAQSSLAVASQILQSPAARA